MSVARRFQVVTIRPPGYQHSDAFKEIAETVYYGLQRLGHVVRSTENSIAADAYNIILGSHLLLAHHVEQFPPNTIVYNLEQIDPNNQALQTSYRFIQRFIAWDYSERNIEQLKRMGLARRVYWAPIGFVPELERISSAATQDIDVLFYGSVNDRRRSILDALRQERINVVAVFGSYGKARDALIARAKIVLNLHFYETKIFELVRVSYLFANRKAVVSECNANTAIEPDLRDAGAFVPYSQIVSTCKNLLADENARVALAERGFAAFSKRDEVKILKRVIAETFHESLSTSPETGH